MKPILKIRGISNETIAKSLKKMKEDNLLKGGGTNKYY